MKSFAAVLVSSIVMLTGAAVFLCGAPTHLTQNKYILYIGAYGKGVSAYRFDAGSGKLEPIGLVGEITNPSFLAADSSFKYLYAASELEHGNGEVGAFSIDAHTGELHKLNTQDSAGVAPCHLAVYKDKVLIVANYGTGGVSSYPLQSDGRLGDMASLMTAKGHGPNTKRQEGPHAHEVVISGAQAYVPDLGLDHIRIYDVAEDGKLTPHDPAFVQQDAGFGPRHMAFTSDQKQAYVVNELKSEVSVFSHDTGSGTMTKLQDVSTLAEGFTGENAPAEILIDSGDRHVYATNRGSDSIAVFDRDAASGRLTQVQVISAEGKMPRGLEIDPTGRYMLVGNQKTNNFVVLKIDVKTGKLTPTGQSITSPSPVAFLFVPAAD